MKKIHYYKLLKKYSKSCYEDFFCFNTWSNCGPSCCVLLLKTLLFFHCVPDHLTVAVQKTREWLVLLPHCKRFLGLNLLFVLGPYVWSLHVLPMLVWVFYGWLGFLAQSKDMQVRSIWDFKLPSCVNMSVNRCLSLKPHFHQTLLVWYLWIQK